MKIHHNKLFQIKNAITTEKIILEEKKICQGKAASNPKAILNKE